MQTDQLRMEFKQIGNISTYQAIENNLEEKDWLYADKLTTLFLRQASGIPKLKLKAKNIPCDALVKVDRLWSDASDGHFGFSVQRELLMEVGGQPGKYHGINASQRLQTAWRKFSQNVGWRNSRGDIQYNNVLELIDSHKTKSPETLPKGNLPWGYRALIDGTATSDVAERIYQCYL